MFLVKRAFKENGIERMRGEIVYGDGYKNTRTLVRSGYIDELDYQVESVVCDHCNREFIDEKALFNHETAQHKKERGVKKHAEN